MLAKKVYRYYTLTSMPHTTASIIAQCRESGLRRTKALELLIDTLLVSLRPMTLAELSEHKNLNTQCDRATVFRLLQRLTDKGVVRRLGLHERAAYFTILLEGRHQDFLICSECGKIEPIKAPCPVHALEREIAASTGFTGLYHELEFFGVCPDCSE